jgi:hypothetical protein
LFLDATQRISKVDQQLAEYIGEEYKPCIFVVNKWDMLVKTMPTEKWVRYLNDTFRTMRYAPIAFITGQTGKNVKALLNHSQMLFKQSRQRIPTGQLNRLLRDAVQRNPPPLYQNRRPKIYYGTQVGIQPPTLVLFCNEPRAISRCRSSSTCAAGNQAMCATTSMQAYRSPPPKLAEKKRYERPAQPQTSGELLPPTSRNPRSKPAPRCSPPPSQPRRPESARHSRTTRSRRRPPTSGRSTTARLYPYCIRANRTACQLPNALSVVLVPSIHPWTRVIACGLPERTLSTRE